MTELAAGTPAPAFELSRLGGGSVTLPAGELTFLVIYKASCPTCRWALPFVQNLHERARGIRVIGVASDSPEDAAALAAELTLTFPIGVEAEPWPVSAAYGLTTVPSVFLVGPDGGILRSGAGFGREDFTDAVQRAAKVTGGAPANPFPEGVTMPAFRPG
jgi:peroxiredoxin